MFIINNPLTKIVQYVMNGCVTLILKSGMMRIIMKLKEKELN